MTDPTPANSPTNPAPPADPPHTPSWLDDAIRRRAAERLSGYLDRGDKFLARCEKMASAPRGDRLGPLAAAARLMTSHARIAQALAHVVLVERRQRTIIERIQPPAPIPPELNSKKPSELRREVEMKFARIVAADRRERLAHPSDPQEEANLMLQEEDWREENLRDRGFEIARGLAHDLRRNV